MIRLTRLPPAHTIIDGRRVAGPRMNAVYLWWSVHSYEDPVQLFVSWSPCDDCRPEHQRGKPTGSLGINPGHEGVAHFLRALELRRVLVDADEVHYSGIGRIGEVRDAT